MSDAQGCRALWSQVILQARWDLAQCAVGSKSFEQAAAFFVEDGQWGDSRTAIAEMVDLHPDDLTRMGRLLIDKRRAEDRFPLPIQAAPALDLEPVPEPVAVAAEPIALAVPRGARKAGISPFSPFRWG